MVEESPAAARPTMCRKHSPWTMERDRKKTKAHLGSPECHEALSEGFDEEEEEEEQDDHEMTEQEAHVIACFGQLNVASVTGGHDVAQGLALSLASSMPEGQRRKVRGSRALSASFHSRLRLCVLNDKGSPLPKSAKPCTEDTADDQDNTPPVMFQAAEQTKCWLARRRSPNNDGAQPPHQELRAAGLVSIPLAHNPVHQVADQSLASAAATVSCARLSQVTCNSPAPKIRSHRRSSSGTCLEGSYGLADSAEILHGAPEVRARGPSTRSGAVTGRSSQDLETSVVGTTASGVRLTAGHAVSDTAVGCSQQDQDCYANPGKAAGRLPREVNIFRDQAVLTSQQTLSSPSSPTGSEPCVAKYGIAAFGVPASLQSCFAAQPAPHTRWQPGSDAHELEVGGLRRRSGLAPSTLDSGTLPPAGSGTFLSAGSTAPGASDDCVGSHGDNQDLVEVSSEPLMAGFGRYGHVGGSAMAANALADSAEEMELRRLTCLPPNPDTRRITRQETQRKLRVSGELSLPGDRKVAAGMPGASVMTDVASFDLLGLAHTAGSLLSGGQASNVAGSAAGSNPAPMSSVARGSCTADDGSFPLSRGVLSWLTEAEADLPSASNAGQVNDGFAIRKPAGVSLGDGWHPGRMDLTMSAAVSVGRGSEPSGIKSKLCGLFASDHAAEKCGHGDGSQRESGVATNPNSYLHSSTAGNNDNDASCEEDGTPWLRTSQQAPDPDDPSSAGKYSAVLLRRLQAAAEDEELYGVAIAGHGSACGLYHLQGRRGGGYEYGGYALRASGYKPFNSNSSSAEPSPMPRLSARLRRMRASPCVGGSSGGYSVSPAPSHLGTRSRSAGVTPGTDRRLRRRSDIIPDPRGGGGSARRHRDVDDPDECGDVGSFGDDVSDHHMPDAPGHTHNRYRHQNSCPASVLEDAAGFNVDGPAASDYHKPPSGPMKWMAAGNVQQHSLRDFQPAQPHTLAGGVSRILGSQHHVSHSSQSVGANDFLNGLMDYDDDGVEYTTPPHTPLRGIGGNHDNCHATAPRAAWDKSLTTVGMGNAVAGLSAAATTEVWDGSKVAAHLRVTFASHKQDERSQHDTSEMLPGGTSHLGADGGATCLVADGLESVHDYNKHITVAANNNDRGGAERLWQEMCSRGVTPNIHTLNALLRCLSRSAADPDDAQALVREVCDRGGFNTNGTSQRYLEEICFRFEQLNGRY